MPPPEIAGYTFRSGAYGSLYQNVSYAQLPSFNEFVATPNNTVMKFIDGAFSGQDVIATWTTNNSLTLPKTQTRSLRAKIDGRTGTLSGTYNLQRPGLWVMPSRWRLSAAWCCRNPARFAAITRPERAPASSCSCPIVTAPQLRSPTSLRARGDVSELGATYKIYVTASEPWTVKVPAGWVNVSPTSGTGNAELVVTVVKNSSNLRRTADLTIAGLTHHIEQDYNRTGGSNVTITPAVKSVTIWVPTVADADYR